MINQDYLSKFNPDATVPHSRIKKLLITIRQLGSSAKSSDDSDENKMEMTPELIEAGMAMTEKLETAKDELTTELVTIFFSLSNQDSENLDFQVREEMYAMISNARPELIGFLGLSVSLKSSMKTESQQLPTVS